ncbi:Prolipoprotein diacylglyceryl transferase [invertebrate metagenome]|uniref:Prolipoprotein diacylglyceryl transferase n=1 Tax=invertebrate metagenome TaxID=1711999 RepID=A0A484H5V2_9ZZZZ
MLFPDLNPIAIAIGPITVRWYALSYVVGIAGSWWYVRFMMRQPASHDVTLTRDHHVEDLIVWVALGIVLGGRLGYVLFYKPLYFLASPLEILFLWQGGMSFHGGLLGVMLATTLFARCHGLSVLGLGDLLGCAAPFGLMSGRIGNFMNGELYGRPASADLPWAAIFPAAGPLPRHPSQIYEALLEGAILLMLLHLSWRIRSLRARRGVLVGLFLLGYGLMRMIAECFREPDCHLGFLFGGATMGQWLSLPMMLGGGLLLGWAWHNGSGSQGQVAV